MKIPLNVPLYIFLVSMAFFGFLFSLFLGQDISLSVFLIFIGIGGLILSFYILYVKNGNKTFICPTGSDCNKVIFSEYSKFFGVPLEYLGILYYAFITVLYSLLIFYPALVPASVIFLGITATAGAFLFSLYLTSIQAFALKQWCMWCLLSALFSTTIFIVSLGKLSAGLAFIVKILPGLLVTHLLGFALGLGGITLIAVLMSKFLKDFRISESELGIIKTVFEVIWFSLATVVLTEFAIYLTSPIALASSPEFMTKILAIGLIAVLGVVINLVILPLLTAISFDEKIGSGNKEFRQLRKISFGVGAVYITSWYFAFALDVIPTLGVNHKSLLTTYSIVLLGAILASQIGDYLIIDRVKNKIK